MSYSCEQALINCVGGRMAMQRAVTPPSPRRYMGVQIPPYALTGEPEMPEARTQNAHL